MQGEKRTRILLGVTLTLVVIIFSLVFFQFPDNTHAKFYFEAIEGEAGCVRVVGYDGKPTVLDIPSTDENGNKVVEIAYQAFSSQLSIERVKIPDTVTRIEKDAFFGCSNLEEVKLSSSLVKIGDSAFAECKQLEEIEFPETLKKIGPNAFDSCSNLEQVYIPASVDEIGGQAFWACENLLLDVSDNPYAAERALAENWETGTVDTTAIYLLIILSATVLGTILVVFVWHIVRNKAQKKKTNE